MENLLMLRRKMAVAKGSGKPYDAEVEYLQSSGTQYIDVGIAPIYPTDTVTLDIQVTAAGGYAYGSGNTYPLKYCIYRNGGGTYVFTQCNATWISASSRMTVVIADKVTVTKEGATSPTVISRNDTSNVTTAPYLFASSRITNSCGTAKVYSYSIERAGEKIIDLIPVRVGTTGYMYDKVSGVLFENKGTGDFTLGNDL